MMIQSRPLDLAVIRSSETIDNSVSEMNRSRVITARFKLGARHDGVFSQLENEVDGDNSASKRIPGDSPIDHPVGSKRAWM